MYKLGFGFNRTGFGVTEHEMKPWHCSSHCRNLWVIDVKSFSHGVVVPPGSTGMNTHTQCTRDTRCFVQTDVDGFFSRSFRNRSLSNQRWRYTMNILNTFYFLQFRKNDWNFLCNLLMISLPMQDGRKNHDSRWVYFFKGNFLKWNVSTSYLWGAILNYSQSCSPLNTVL